MKKGFSLIRFLEGIEGVIIIAAGYLTLFLKPFRDRWGLTKAEAQRELPGDSLVKEPKSVFSHGIEIDAPASFVWPWVAQMGKDRAGFYSYEALENLTGLQIYNAETILEEHQHPRKGDIIPFGPKNGYPIAIYEEGRALVIENCDDLDAKTIYDPLEGRPENFLHISWLWYVEPLDNDRSRFISRNRVDFKNSFANHLKMNILAEPVVFAMDRKMCIGIKKRAERWYRQHGQNTVSISDLPSQGAT